MNASHYTHQIKPVIEPDRANGELGVFNPTACFDKPGKLQLLYRAVNSAHVTRLNRSVFDGDHFIRQKPITIRVATGDAVTDSFVTTALKNSEEDPRFIRLPEEEGWYVTMVGLRLPAGTDGQKAVTVLAKVSDDFEAYEVRRLLTPGELDDRHVMPFPEKVDGSFVLLSRPQKPGRGAYVDFYTSQPSRVYLSRTLDITRRPNDRPLLSPQQPWEAKRIGGVGPQPVLTSRGWLVVYMGVDQENHTSVGAALLEPASLKVIARTPNPLLTPDDAYNRRFRTTGFGLQNVIFATTALVDEVNNSVTFLLGCNEVNVGSVSMPLRDIFNEMDRTG